MELKITFAKTTEILIYSEKNKVAGSGFQEYYEFQSISRKLH